MPTFSDIRTYVGLGLAVLLLGVSILKKRRFDPAYLFPAAAVFFAGINLPIAAYLCYYGLNSNLNRALPNELKGYEPYIAFAGFASFFVSIFGIITYFQKAFKIPQRRR